MWSWLKGAFANPALEARKRIEEGALVIDVRTPGEWRTGHLPSARHLPVDELRARMAEVDAWSGGDKGRPIVVYCASGARSARARQLLVEAGYTQVTNGGGYASLAS
jgi:phage shock protein E